MYIFTHAAIDFYAWGNFIINSVYCWRVRLGWERMKSFHNSFQYQIICCLLLFTSIYFYTIWWTKNAKKRKLQVKLQYNLIENKITDWEVAEFLLLSPYKYILLRIISPQIQMLHLQLFNIPPIYFNQFFPTVWHFHLAPISSLYVLLQLKRVQGVRKESDRQVSRPVQNLRLFPTWSHDIPGQRQMTYY